jgi:hypothetical protein
MRSSRSARALAALILACCTLAALAPAAGAKGRVDRSFGGGKGFVDLGAELGKGRGVGEVATGRGGAIFVSEETYGHCGHSLCFYSAQLKRYRADGRLAQRFVPGSAIRRATSWVRVAVDTRGRPLLAWEKKDGKHVAVRRLRRPGGVDRPFGDAGTVTLPCDCNLESIEPLPGGGLLVAAARELGGYSGHHSAIWFIAKLRPDGSGDPRFGGDGLVRLLMRGRGGAAATAGPSGSVLLSSEACCGEKGLNVAFVSRLSPSGRLEHGFGAAYRRAVPSIFGARIGEFWEWTWFGSQRSAVQGFASGWHEARVFRLHGDGRLDRSFGRRGVSVLPLAFAGFAPESDGGMMVVGYHRRGYQVRRIDADGRPDHSFGVLRLPNAAYNEEGLSIYPQGRGAAVVLALDQTICRSDCLSDPKLFRVLR